MINLKEKLKNRELTIGSWLTFSDPAIAELMAHAGFDWLALDMEHSSLSFNQAQQLIRVIELSNLPPLVRVLENNPDLIKRYMDAGAHGVIVPMVCTKEEAQRAVDAVKYPPMGKRGVGLARAQKYSLDLESYRDWNQKNSVVIVQIEHIKAVENFKEIISVEHIDGIMIGPYDLSGSLGVPGEFDNPNVQEALAEIRKVAKENNILLGEHVVRPDVELLKNKISKGATFVGFGTDFLFLNDSVKSKLNELKL